MVIGDYCWIIKNPEFLDEYNKPIYIRQYASHTRAWPDHIAFENEQDALIFKLKFGITVNEHNYKPGENCN